MARPIDFLVYQAPYALGDPDQLGRIRFKRHRSDNIAADLTRRVPIKWLVPRFRQRRL